VVKAVTCYLFFLHISGLKCNGTQGNAVPHLQFIAQSVPPPQIVILVVKGTRPLSGAQPECSVPPPLVMHFNHWQ